MSFADRFSFFRRSDPTAYRFRQDSCLDHIDETLSCASSGTGRKKQCYSVPSGEHNKRRATIMTTTQGSSLLEISKSGGSSSNKFLSFIHKGFHKSKSSTKFEKEKSRNGGGTACSTTDNCNLQDIIPIPIRETAMQGHSRTLFHKVPNSNLRAKPLITLAEDTKITPIHCSILSTKFRYCVKILSVSPNVHRESEGNKYELMLPTGARSLGQTCRIVTEDENREKCRSCHSSQLSLFSSEQVKKPMVGYIFSCVNQFEQNRWISVLTRVARPNQQNQRRKEISLNLWIQEAKNIPVKKRYFCEVYLDNCLHARTTAKIMGDMLFWGEEFNLCNLEEVSVVTFLLWRSAEESRSKKKKSQKKLICQINISTTQMDQRTSVEKWYSPTSNFISYSPESPQCHINQGILSTANAVCVPITQTAQISSLNHVTATQCPSNDQVPMLRIKARYQHLDVLPLASYVDLIKFLNENAVKTLSEIEPYLKVKAKEDLAQNLIKIIHKQGTAVPILCDLIVNEINKSDDKNLILRGNTMASKAMEIYLKLIGEKYLQLTLSDFINRVLLEHDDCEVDPQKDKFDFYGGSSTTGLSSPGFDKNSPQYSLQQRQESLMMNVDMVWAKIMSSSIYFPKGLRTVFVTLRQRLYGTKPSQPYSQYNDQPDLCDRIISSCIFLRYLCPAILTPSLFGLIPEYPDNPKVTRTFTLVAKCIQTLANFSNLCGTKETYMVFMNNFIESNFKTMRDFLREISGTGEPENGRKNSKLELESTTSTEGREYLYWENLGTNLPEDTIDLALCLATVHQQMEDCLQIMTPQNFSSNTRQLHNILEALNVTLRQDESLPIKYSNSYQNIRVQAPPHHEHINLKSSEAPDSRTKVDPREVPIRTRPKQPKYEIPRQSSHSHSAESTPTHQLQDRAAATAEFLMTQSMMEESRCGLDIPKATQAHSQVDSEWKAMLSASYAYNNRSREMFFAESTGGDKTTKSTNSSGYQTLSRSTDSLGKSVDNTAVVPKSPSLSLKPSVKKCKQARRQTEVIPRQDTFSVSGPAHTRPKTKDSLTNSLSSEEARQVSAQGQCYTLDDTLDSCSTQTLTAANVSNSASDEVVEERAKLVNSVSMPAFHSTFEYDNGHPPDFYTAFQECRPAKRTDQVLLKRASIDETSASTAGKSAFHEPITFRQHNLGTKSRMEKIVAINDTERIKYSLNNLRQTLNSRMKQLLLADRTTIQLELERVRLMRRICDTATINGSISVNSSLTLPNERHSQTPHATKANGSILAKEPPCERMMPIKKYLDLAENVLLEAHTGLEVSAKARQRDLEDLLVYIFQTNQNLQNSLMSRSGRGLQAESVPKPPSDQSGSTMASRGQAALRTLRSSSGQPLADSLKSSSLGSLMTSSSAGLMLEIVDAV